MLSEVLDIVFFWRHSNKVSRESSKMLQSPSKFKVSESIDRKFETVFSLFDSTFCSALRPRAERKAAVACVAKRSAPVAEKVPRLGPVARLWPQKVAKQPKYYGSLGIDKTQNFVTTDLLFLTFETNLWCQIFDSLCFSSPHRFLR